MPGAPIVEIREPGRPVRRRVVDRTAGVTARTRAERASPSKNESSPITLPAPIEAIRL
jgi:hypothetical protein